MATWAKVAVAMMLGGFLGAILGGAAQSKLIFSVYYADHITRQFTLSGEMCFLLGAFTGAAFVLWKETLFNGAALFSVVGPVLCLIWLGIDRDSRLYSWWNPVGNSPLTPREHMANVIMFNGIPLLWTIALLWWGMKLLSRKRKEAQAPLTQIT